MDNKLNNTTVNNKLKKGEKDEILNAIIDKADSLIVKRIIKLLQLTEDPLFLNKIFLTFVILGTLILYFIIKNRPLYIGMIAIILGMVSLVVFKIIGYVMIFDSLFYYLYDDIDLQIMHSQFQFFSFYNPWIMITEIIAVGFIVDLLIMKILFKKYENENKIKKVKLKLNYDESIERNGEISKIYEINFKSNITKTTNTFSNPDLIYIFTYLRILININVGYFFSHPNLFSFKLTNKAAAILIYLDLLIFILIPLFLYISMLIYIESKNLKKIITNISLIFKTIYKSICRIFNFIRKLVCR